MVWELGSRERLAQRNFKVWDLGACSMPVQVRLPDPIKILATKSLYLMLHSFLHSHNARACVCNV